MANRNYEYDVQEFAHMPVSEKFRTTLLKYYPILNRRPKLLSLMAYLMFTSFHDQATGWPVIPYHVLAAIEGKQSQLPGRNYCGEKLLKEFQSEVMTEETCGLRKHSYYEGRARVMYLELKPEVEQALMDELTGKHRGCDNQLVYLDTGRAYSEKEERKRYRELLAYARRITANGDYRAERILRYLDARSSAIYTRNANSNIEAARTFVRVHVFDELNDANNRRIKMQNLKILRRIELMPKPIYRPSIEHRTERIFTIESNYMGLNSDVRAILFQGCYDYDLVSSQLTICAAMWIIDAVIEFLARLERTGTSIWKELMCDLGIDTSLETQHPQVYKALKKLLKEALYSTVYGMSVAGIRWNLNRNALLQKYTEKASVNFLSHPLIVAILTAREAEMARIRSVGHGVDCFGRVIYVERKGAKDNVPSIMAQMAQAVELKLLLPVIELAESAEREMQIVLWCHDGFIVNYSHPDREASWRARMIECINKEAKELGIQARLESKLLAA